MKRTTLLIAALALSFAGNARAEEATKLGDAFLKLTYEQRYYWISGAVFTLAHYVAADENNKAKGECITKWFLDKKAVRLKQIEDSLAMHPEESPTTIIFALVRRTCGIFPDERAGAEPGQAVSADLALRVESAKEPNPPPDAKSHHG